MSWLYSLTKQFANKFLGGRNNDYSYSDEILEFDPLTGQWQEVAKMNQERVFHAMAVVNFESELCV